MPLYGLYYTGERQTINNTYVKCIFLLAAWVCPMTIIVLNKDKTEKSFLRSCAFIFMCPLPLFITTNSQTADKQTENEICPQTVVWIKYESVKKDVPSIRQTILVFRLEAC